MISKFDCLFCSTLGKTGVRTFDCNHDIIGSPSILVIVVLFSNKILFSLSESLFSLEIRNNCFELLKIIKTIVNYLITPIFTYLTLIFSYEYMILFLSKLWLALIFWFHRIVKFSSTSLKNYVGILRRSDNFSACEQSILT